MKRVLISWIGKTDLRARTEAASVGLGPLAQAIEALPFDQIELLSDLPSRDTAAYVSWLCGRAKAPVRLHEARLASPTDYAEIYLAATSVVERVRDGLQEEHRLCFHLSPGTPAMAAIWLLLSKTRFPAELVESSVEAGVRTVTVPFDLSLEVIPELLRAPDKRLQEMTAGLPPAAPEFSAIVHRSDAMKRVVGKARRVALRSVPVLIEGESGTGKELFARAIHHSGPRANRPFVAVNCGAIPEQLVESELFGHARGAFTGADRSREGLIESADQGTLFLDEIGELSKMAQVKLLRFLQEGEVRRVGSTTTKKVDIRVIAATNRCLIDEVGAGRFRDDLYFRLAVAVLGIPPLRAREGDVGLLADLFLATLNQQWKSEPGYGQKHFSASARNLMLQHGWPGNVRELLNTVVRAAVWATGDVIGSDDVQEALSTGLPNEDSLLLDQPLTVGFSLPGILSKTAAHYLAKALAQARGNKTKAAELLGLRSYQTLTNWAAKYGVTV